MSTPNDLMTSKGSYVLEEEFIFFISRNIPQIHQGQIVFGNIHTGHKRVHSDLEKHTFKLPRPSVYGAELLMVTLLVRKC